MARALRSRPQEQESRWSEPGFGIGKLERPLPGADDVPKPLDTSWAPAQQGPFKLWMGGEVYCSGRAEIDDPEAPRTLAFRESLLADMLDGGLDVLRSLDGEFWVALWDSRERILQIASDRFGGLPLYYAQSTEGAAFAGGVRGILMAPGLDSKPDPDAIREAVTFGGFRLGGRTNVAAVEMLPGGSALKLADTTLRQQRYWSYQDIPRVSERPRVELIERAEELWRRAIERRLRGSGRFGQTLSGGLDSRAILAEAVPQAPTWAAVSYGVRDCDDVRYARRAAAVRKAEWHYYDIYRDPVPDWLTSRSRHIQGTDGMIELFDLMHVETVARQTKLMDVHLSGYIGDAVCGPTFARIETPDDVMAGLPFYGTLAMPYDEARDRVQAQIERLEGAPLRYAIFENKLPQATNRWTAGWRPWLSVRKPFVDYALFDFWQGLPRSVRLEGNLFEHWLLHSYPELFAEIPNQNTGVPILTPAWRYQLARTARFGWRRCAPFLGVAPKPRYYHDVANQWTAPENRARIEDTVLRDGSVSAELLGRDELKSFLKGWFDAGDGPTQVIAALYVYEHYHRDLPSHLRDARQ